MPKGETKQSFAVVGLLTAAMIIFVIITILSGAVFITFLAHTLAGIPYAVDVPYYVKGLGGIVLSIGLVFVGWVFRYRHPKDVIISTWVTLRKLLRRVKVEEMAGRNEKFVPRGPYRYVRNPIYFGVVSVLLGGSALLGSTVLFFWGLLVALWFWFFLIPFEERELRVLFGSTYENYQKQVPMMFPYGRRYREPVTHAS